MNVFLHLLHLFGFSPLCVIICLLKLPSTKKAYSQSKHFGILSIMCFQMKFQIGCRSESISAFVPFIWVLVWKTKKKGSKKSPSTISPLFSSLPKKSLEGRQLALWRDYRVNKFCIPCALIFLMQLTRKCRTIYEQKNKSILTSIKCYFQASLAP